MKDSTGRVFLAMLFLLGFHGAFAQDIWNTPWAVIGDSTKMKPDQKVMVTGTITSDSGTPVTGASISAETFKYFDYADQSGRYLLELPAGRYRITIKHVGMKPVYLRLHVLSRGVKDITLIE